MRHVIILFMLLSMPLFAQDKVRIAVLDLRGEGISESEARIISSRFRANLFETNTFTVVERDRMNEVLSEQGFQMSGCTSDECAVEAGRLLGVRVIALGEVGKIGNIYTASIRLIDVETGRMLKVTTQDCECPIEKFLQETIKEVAYSFAGKKQTEKPKPARKFYFAPQIGYGFADGQKLGFGARAGWNFGEKFTFGTIFIKHFGTDESYDGIYYEETYINAMYLGIELGYTIRKEVLIIYPYIIGGYANGTNEWYVEDMTGIGGVESEVGPVFGGAGVALNFKLSEKISVGPDVRFVGGAPEHEFSVFLNIGFNL